MSWNDVGAGLADTTGIEYLDGLYGYAMILTRNHLEAEDLVQETYLRAIPAMGRLRTGSNVKSWFFTILKNIWLNGKRSRRNVPEMIEIRGGDDVSNHIVEPSKDSYDLYVTKMEAEQVRAAIQELPGHFREVILLREYEELSYQEIANILNCPIGTVMSRLGRARGKLRSLLQLSESRSQMLPVEQRGDNRNAISSARIHLAVDPDRIGPGGERLTCSPRSAQN